MISATGNAKITIFKGTRIPRGMTLLELMLVLLIIGLLSAAVVLTLPSDSGARELRQLAERMTGYFRYARQEAVFSGTSHGILWRGRRPLLVKRGAEGWEVRADSRLEALQETAATYRMFLDRDGKLLDLSQDFQTPQLLFTNDGQVAPFTLIIRGEDGLEVTLTDSLTLEPEE